MSKKFHKMKYLLIVLIITGFLSYTNILHGNEFEDKTENVMLAYFHALKNGDVQKIISLLTDPILSSKRDLLERNTEYPEYLRKSYKDSTMIITESGMTNDKKHALLTTKIFFKGHEHPLISQFLLRNTDEGWKISEELGME